MKKIILSMMLASGLLATVSCDKDFEEVNTTTNRPLEIPAHLLLGNVIRLHNNITYNAQFSGDMGLCWAQHWSKVVYNDEERYIPRVTALDGIWDGYYVNVLSNAKSMYEFAEVEGNSNLKGISLVLQANAFQILTDLYGPIPFSEFKKDGDFTPVYDSQEAVYAGINTMLIQADQLLAANVGEVPATSDLIYGGDASKWRKFANSLRLKALMRISKKKNVATEVADLVAAGNLMSSNADSAQLVYLSAQPDANPIYETIVYGARPEYKVSSVLVNKLQSSNDPRLAVFAQKNNANAYVGNVPGVEDQSAINAVSSPGTFYLRPELPGVMLSYAQVQFLLAEAANEGYIAGGQAQALVYYNNGITANMNFNGIAASAIATYLAQPAIAFSTQTEAREKIAEQVWLSLYGQGFEAWTEWRRTKFPVLSPVLNAAESSIPGRLVYNSKETSLNQANYAAAVATIPGGDKLTSPVWWMN